MMNRLFLITIFMFSLYTVKAQDTVAKDTTGKSAYRMICFATIAPEGPLYIHNGKEISKEKFERIDTKKIQELIILKDASATAIYGIKGANGVIIVSTKKKKQKN